MRLVIISLMSLLGSVAFAVPPVIVGQYPTDVQPVFNGFNLKPLVVDTLAQVPVDTQSVFILSDATQPRVLSDADCNQIEALMTQGCNVYLEYATTPPGRKYAGFSMQSQAIRPLYERLVVLQPTGSLQPEDLLEEHDAACYPFDEIPDGAKILLEYDRAFGTYSREALPDRSVYTVTVDLGEIQELSSAGQMYGAGEPNYAPDHVELWLSEDGIKFEKNDSKNFPETINLTCEIADKKARFVKFVAQKFKRSPVTDFFFMGEISILDMTGKNISVGCSYQLESRMPIAEAYADDRRKLTDGIIEKHWSDRTAVGWLAPELANYFKQPALVKSDFGKGLLINSSLCLSTFRQRNFRLTERWEELWREIILSVLPISEQARAKAAYVPLKAYAEPRNWVTPGTETLLKIETAPGAQVIVKCATLKNLTVINTGIGHFETRFIPSAGQYEIEIEARTGTGQTVKKVTLDCCSREEKYRQALDRNMQWFAQSGVLPKADGSSGVVSQVCMAWLDSQPVGYDFLASPFRVDCNAMTAETCYLYGRLTDNETWREIGKNIADTVVAHQYTDPSRTSLGGFPWLYENCDVIYFWDDNSRIGNALLWMYHWTGDEKYLHAALLNGELFRQVARDDACVHNHAISAAEFDRITREEYRRFTKSVDVDFRLPHWWNLAAVTGDTIYKKLAEDCFEIWGTGAGLEGLAFAQWYSGRHDPTQVGQWARQMLASESMHKYGAPTVGGGGNDYAFTGDCNIATHDGEPLTDQIYVTPWLFRSALRAWCATGDEDCRKLCEAIGDYLVRIQHESGDARLDGCWMRGFDVEAWEEYGAPYDPQYGPYSAYTGWMNAVAASAFAWYLSEESPFIEHSPGEHERIVLEKIRAMNPVQITDGKNLAKGCKYSLSSEANGSYVDDGKKLTDGIIDGPYQDKKSVGWSLSEVGKSLAVQMLLDLEEIQSLTLVTQQYGAGQGTYNPDTVTVSGSETGEDWKVLGEQTFGSQGAGLLWLKLRNNTQARYLKFEYSKKRLDKTTDFMFLGETKVFKR